MVCSQARVVKWQTRTFEGRMPKGMGVQVPPRAGRFAERPTPKAFAHHGGQAEQALNVQRSTFNVQRSIEEGKRGVF